jgi:hypothetical protein
MGLGFGESWQPPTLPKYHYHNFVPHALLTKIVFVVEMGETWSYR